MSKALYRNKKLQGEHGPDGRRCNLHAAVPPVSEPLDSLFFNPGQAPTSSIAERSPAPFAAARAPLQRWRVQRWDWQMKKTQPETLSEPSLLRRRRER